METYRQIENYEGLYEVSDLGNVRSLRRNRLMKPYKMPNGYLHVALTKDRICSSLRIHRLVANEFIPNPLDLPEINHLDGNKENNQLTNLQRVNRSENMIHALENNLTSAKGETHYRARLTELEVKEIREKYSKGSKQIRLAEEYGVSDKTIHKIVKNKGWKSIL